MKLHTYRVEFTSDVKTERVVAERRDYRGRVIPAVTYREHEEVSIRVAAATVDAALTKARRAFATRETRSPKRTFGVTQVSRGEEVVV